MKHLWTGLWITILIASVIVLTASLQLGYDGFITAAMHLLHQESHLEIAFRFVTPAEFLSLQLLLFVWIAGIAGLPFLLKKYALATSFIQFAREGITSVWKTVIHTDAKYILLIPLACALYYAITLPVTYDEAFTYVYFTRNSPLVSVSFYPAPNNHILFSLITNFTQYIPFISPLLSIRLPSMVASLIAWCVLYYAYKKWSGEKPALLLAAIVSMMFMAVYYSFMARGYALVMLFFIVSCYAVWQIAKDNRSDHYWILFTLCSVLGCYTMPSYAYSWLSCCALLTVYAVSGRIKLLVSIGITLIVTGLLYLPVIIVSGINSVINNKYLQRIPFHVFRSKADSFWYQSIGEITGLHTMLVLALLGIGVLYLIMHRRWRVLNVFFLTVFTPVLILTYQSIIPFARTFVYLLPVWIIVIAAPYRSWLESFSKRIVISIAIALQVILWYNFHRIIIPYDSVYRDYHTAAMFVLGDQQDYYFNSELFDTVLAFELTSRGYNMRTATNFYPTIPHPMSADSIAGYDYIITDRNLDETKLKQPAFQTTHLTIYQ